MTRVSFVHASSNFVPLLFKRPNVCASLSKMEHIMLRGGGPWAVTHFLVNQQMIRPWLRCSGIYVHNPTRRRPRERREHFGGKQRAEIQEACRTQYQSERLLRLHLHCICLSIWIWFPKIRGRLGGRHSPCLRRQLRDRGGLHSIHTSFARITSLPLFYSSSSLFPFPRKFPVTNRASERCKRVTDHTEYFQAWLAKPGWGKLWHVTWSKW